jgi:hypothetical protein
VNVLVQCSYLRAVMVTLSFSMSRAGISIQHGEPSEGMDGFASFSVDILFLLCAIGIVGLKLEVLDEIQLRCEQRISFRKLQHAAAFIATIRSRSGQTGSPITMA